jgi:hypothetical protein
MKTILTAALLLVLFFRSFICAGQGCFPADKLPSHISPLTDFGQRAEWSLDNKAIFFLDSAGGNVWSVDVFTKELKQITRPEHKPENHGYYRVFVKWNGNLLLGHGPRRHELHFQILDQTLERPPWNIEGELFNEGPAVSRLSNKIAWTGMGQRQIYTGEWCYTSEGEPTIINKRLVLDNSEKPIVDEQGRPYPMSIIETQDFNPRDENILIWNHYGGGCEVMSINLITGKIINHTKSPHTYDEAENIFPGGEYTTTESDRHWPGKGIPGIDIYKLRLDDQTESYVRLTYFTDLEGFRSSNPVISDCGRYMAFQASYYGARAGHGCGLYIFDFDQYTKNLRGF